ncbi:MAG TPA: phage holin family protein [Candidatus Woesebacteria bacterium]|nr:phage holin family protein [Candidatus Woesebacteria bacterium]
MKTLLRNTLINVLVFYVVSACYSGFSIYHDLKTLLTAAIIWMILNKIVKPIIKLLLLPINLITLNLFSWAVSLITLFLLPVLVSGITISPYWFPGISYQGFTIPSFHLSLFWSYVVTSSLLNIFHNSIVWLIKKDSD